ncbi:MAG: hypothetical protein M3460_21930 [Actinomycetota bacterium]|nr:hypothetical protein [Actinomycetota bacterium]
MRPASSGAQRQLAGVDAQYAPKSYLNLECVAGTGRAAGGRTGEFGLTAAARGIYVAGTDRPPGA